MSDAARAGGIAVAPSRRIARRPGYGRRRGYLLFVVPALLATAVVILFPWLFTLYMSAQDWQIASPRVDLNGMAAIWVKPWHHYSNTSGVGDPTQATADQGRRWIEASAEAFEDAAAMGAFLIASLPDGEAVIQARQTSERLLAAFAGCSFAQPTIPTTVMTAIGRPRPKYTMLRRVGLGASIVKILNVGMLTANTGARPFYDRLGFHEIAVPDPGPLTYLGRATG